MPNSTTPFTHVAHYAGRPLTLVIDGQHRAHFNLNQVAAILNDDDDENSNAVTSCFLSKILADSIAVFDLHNGLQACYVDANRLYVYLRNLATLAV